MKTNEHNYTIRLSKGSLYMAIRGKKALTQQRVELYRVKNSSNLEFFVLYICQKYIEKEWRPPAATTIYTKRKELNEHLET